MYIGELPLGSLGSDGPSFWKGIALETDDESSHHIPPLKVATCRPGMLIVTIRAGLDNREIGRYTFEVLAINEGYNPQLAIAH